MNTTLEYVFRAAMGQCSTIPMATDPAEHGPGGAYDYSSNHRVVVDGRQTGEDGRAEQWNTSDEMSTTPLMNEGGVNAPKGASKHRSGGGRLHKDLNMHKFFGAVKHTMGGTGGGETKMYQQAYGMGSGGASPVNSPRTVVLPPESAVRTRCYRLNLNTEMFAPPTTAAANQASQNVMSGPYRCDSHAALGDRSVDALSTYVGFSPSLDDSIADDHRDTIASTARIFRGLTVNSDGSVISHHHRSKGTGPKKDEKSRQSAKIDKAVEMAEEAVRKGAKQTKSLSSSRDEAESENKMISLVIFGEYDDMKSLVRDGAKRLKENQAALDDALWALNKQRFTPHGTMYSNDGTWGQQQQYGNPSSPTDANYRMQANGRNKIIPTSAPPKLHRHPRDRPGSNIRREMAQRASTTNASRSKRFPPWRKNTDDGFFNAGESDWSDALLFSKGLYSMCVCGANSISPTSGSGKYGDTMSPPGMMNTGMMMTKEGREPSVGNNANYKATRFGANDGRESAYNGAKDTIMV